MKRYNFTLVEILGVIALIVILMVISVGVYTYAMDSSKEKATKATITRLHSALQLLQDKGQLPVTGEFVNIALDPAGRELKISGTVVGGTTSSKDNYKGKIYTRFAQAIDADSVASIQNNSGELCDAWGQPLKICFPGKFNKGGIDILSAGGDGGFGKDVATAPVTDIDKYKDSEGDVICDDVSNFF